MSAVFAPLPGSGWQFYTSGKGEPPFALGIRGSSALLAGPADGEELAGFLEFLGVRQLRTTHTVPKNWKMQERFCRMVRSPGRRFLKHPGPEGIRLNEKPAVSRVADLLCQGESLHGEESVWDCFYSETCTLVNHGRALVWTAETEDGRTVATGGAYALWKETAYLAGVETLREERGKGAGSFLVTELSSRLASQGFLVELLCRPEREMFYQRLGFETREEISSFRP